MIITQTSRDLTMISEHIVTDQKNDVGWSTRW